MCHLVDRPSRFVEDRRARPCTEDAGGRQIPGKAEGDRRTAVLVRRPLMHLGGAGIVLCGIVAKTEFRKCPGNEWNNLECPLEFPAPARRRGAEEIERLQRIGNLLSRRRPVGRRREGDAKAVGHKIFHTDFVIGQVQAVARRELEPVRSRRRRRLCLIGGLEGTLLVQQMLLFVQDRSARVEQAKMDGNARSSPSLEIPEKSGDNDLLAGTIDVPVAVQHCLILRRGIPLAVDGKTGGFHSVVGQVDKVEVVFQFRGDQFQREVA